MSHFGHYLIDRRERGRHTEFSVAGGAIVADLQVHVAATATHQAHDAAHRAARADSRDEGVDLAFHLLPDLGAGRLVVGARVRLVRELARLGAPLEDFVPASTASTLRQHYSKK